jgi:hypothetical protein
MGATSGSSGGAAGSSGRGAGAAEAGSASMESGGVSSVDGGTSLSGGAPAAGGARDGGTSAGGTNGGATSAGGMTSSGGSNGGATSAGGMNGAGGTCSGGLTQCASSCVDTKTNASHCGACGRSCYLGACNGTCQPWKVVDAPNTTLPSLLVTDGTYVVWFDSGSTSIRQAKFDKTAVMTLSKDATAFATSPSAYGAPFTLGGGVVLVATASGVYKAVVNTASTGSTPLSFNTPTGAALSALGLDPTGKHLGLTATKSSPQTSQVYDCQVDAATCTAVGASFTGGVYGAAANAAAYYFMNAQGSSVQYFNFGSTTLKTLQANASISVFVTLDSTSAYWLAGANGTTEIWRGALGNGSVTQTVTDFPLNTKSWSALATDGKNVYFSAAGDSAYVGYASVGGAGQTAKVLATTSGASGVAAAGGKVFWIDGTAIWGVAAP